VFVWREKTPQAGQQVLFAEVQIRHLPDTRQMCYH